MPTPDAVEELDPRYSADDASPTSWTQARKALAEAELSWITAVRPDERKCRSLARTPYVVLTTGTASLSTGLDLVVEGAARRVTDDTRLHRLAWAWVSKYREQWRFDVGYGVFRHPRGGGEAWVYAVDATTAFGFGKARTPRRGGASAPPEPEATLTDRPHRSFAPRAPRRATGRPLARGSSGRHVDGCRPHGTRPLGAARG